MLRSQQRKCSRDKCRYACVAAFRYSAIQEAEWASD
jgi:hypothetical protein